MAGIQSGGKRIRRPNLHQDHCFPLDWKGSILCPLQSDFRIVFDQLKKILKPYAAKLTVTADNPSAYSLDGPYSQKWNKNVFFGAAQIKKNYVSFYLMPVYMFPDLHDAISPDLKKHMQGKSCFNFKKVEPGLFRELEDLTRKGIVKFREEN